MYSGVWISTIVVLRALLCPYQSALSTLLFLIGSTLTMGGRSLSWFLKPIICPTRPPGFGTGHSLFLLLAMASISSVGALRPDTAPSTIWPAAIWLPSASTPGAFRLRRRRPSGDNASTSLSAYARVLTGQGRMCGMPTTRKEMARVVVNRVAVERERGCRCGGMAGDAWRMMYWRREAIDAASGGLRQSQHLFEDTLGR